MPSRVSRRTAVAVLVVAGLAAFGLTRLPVAAGIVSLAESARAWGWWGVAAFVAAYVASTVALVPGSILTLAAGFVYGPVWGLALVSPASVLGATAAFLLGRTVLGGWARRQVGHSPRLAAMERAVAREGFRLVLLLRLSPLFPFTVMNYALSLSGVPLRTYVGASAIGMLPGTAMYVYLGSLAPTAASLIHGRPASRWNAALYGAGLAATVVAAIVAARAARRALADAEMA